MDQDKRATYLGAQRVLTATHAAYQQAAEDYRARRINDAEFIAARRVYSAAGAAFDALVFADEKGGAA